MTALPTEITSLAYRARNGELAWRRAHIPQALDSIRSAGFAVLGWEAWIAVGNSRWDGLIPGIRGEREIWGGDTAGRRKRESWQEYCDRTAAQTLEQINATPESDCIAESRDQLRYNITYVTERE